MTSPSSTSIFSLVLMAFLCNMMVTGLPTAVENRQSKQIFLAPQYIFPSYFPLSFYNPYGEAIAKPAEVNPSEDPNLHYAPSSTGNVAIEAADNSRMARSDIKIISSAGECLTADVAANGGAACKAASQDRLGSIDIKLIAADQLANVAVTASSPNTRVRLTCTEIVAAAVFTQNGKINAPSDTPRTEFGFLNLVVVSTGDNARVKCSWRI